MIHLVVYFLPFFYLICSLIGVLRGQWKLNVIKVYHYDSFWSNMRFSALYKHCPLFGLALDKFIHFCSFDVWGIITERLYVRISPRSDDSFVPRPIYTKLGSRWVAIEFSTGLNGCEICRSELVSAPWSKGEALNHLQYNLVEDRGVVIVRALFRCE